MSKIRLRWRSTGLAVAVLGILYCGGCGSDSGTGPSDASSGVASVSGTVWSGRDSDGDFYTWRFLSGGLASYTSPSGTFSNATWQQQGARVTWETNNHYADYEGTITGSQMTGTAHNVVGRFWTFSLTRQ